MSFRYCTWFTSFSFSCVPFVGLASFGYTFCFCCSSCFFCLVLTSIQCCCTSCFRYFSDFFCLGYTTSSSCYTSFSNFCSCYIFSVKSRSSWCFTICFSFFFCDHGTIIKDVKCWRIRKYSGQPLKNAVSNRTRCSQVCADSVRSGCRSGGEQREDREQQVGTVHRDSDVWRSIRTRAERRRVKWRAEVRERRKTSGLVVC